MSGTELMTTSMYSELLRMSLTGEDAAANAPREEQLLEELRERRRRMQDGRLARRVDPPSRVADELAYDRTLIKLCRLHSISCDAARFTRPPRERRRLEEALEAAGVDVHAFRPRGERATTRGPAQEPPEGS